MAFVPFTKEDQPTMANFNAKFLEAILEGKEQALSAGTKIATGSYTGTGTYGASNPCSLKFDFEPKIIIIPFYYAGSYWNPVGHGSNGSSIQTGIMVGSTLTTSWQKDIGFGLATTSGGSWCDRYGRKLTDGTFQWYSTGDDMAQFNESGWKYHYIAIG